MLEGVMNAAGTLGKEALPEEHHRFDILVTKTVTLEARSGNPPPRLVETPCGMINSIGLANPGLMKFLREDLPEWASCGKPVVVSVGADRHRDFAHMVERVTGDSRIVAIELNLSCPNHYDPFQTLFSSDPEAVEFIVDLCNRKNWASKPIIAKLGYENARESSSGAEEMGASALTLINTLPALRRDPRSSQAILGGLSGPAIRPLALRTVWEVAKVVEIPIIGCGGARLEDVEEFRWAGAAAVQIGSGTWGGGEYR